MKYIFTSIDTKSNHLFLPKQKHTNKFHHQCRRWWWLRKHNKAISREPSHHFEKHGPCGAFSGSSTIHFVSHIQYLSIHTDILTKRMLCKDNTWIQWVWAFVKWKASLRHIRLFDFSWILGLLWWQLVCTHWFESVYATSTTFVPSQELHRIYVWHSTCSYP